MVVVVYGETISQEFQVWYLQEDTKFKIWFVAYLK